MAKNALLILLSAAVCAVLPSFAQDESTRKPDQLVRALALKPSDVVALLEELLPGLISFTDHKSQVGCHAVQGGTDRPDPTTRCDTAMQWRAPTGGATGGSVRGESRADDPTDPGHE